MNTELFPAYGSSLIFQCSTKEMRASLGTSFSKALSMWLSMARSVFMNWIHHQKLRIYTVYSITYFCPCYFCPMLFLPFYTK